MKKKRKDKSTRVVITSAVVVTVLVGATVFSLYSLAESEDDGLYLSVSADEGNDTSHGKLLTKLDDQTDTADSESLWLAEPVEASEMLDLTAESEETETEAAPVSKTVQEIVDSEEEISAVNVSGEINLVTLEDQMVSSTDETAAELTAKSADSSETEEENDVTTEEIVEPEESVKEKEAMAYIPTADVSKADLQVNEEAAPAEEQPADNPIGAAPEIFDEVPSISSDTVMAEPQYDDTEDASDSGVWVFDYDAEDSESDDSAYDNTVWDDTSFDYEQNDDAEDTSYSGEWVFNYDTEEWEYVESYDDSAYDNTAWEDTSYDYEQYDDAEDTSYSGEWVFNYDTEEWEYIESYDDSADDNGNWDDESYDDTEDTSYSGEWVFNYDTEEWEYVESAGDDYTDDSYEEDDYYDSWEDDSSDEDDYSEDDTYTDDNYSSLGQQIVDYAMGFVGVTPYVWAGGSLYSGTDCSGFVHLIYEHFGIYCSTASLSYDGSSFGYIIDSSEARPGDIAVYGGGDHVAIYAGNGYVVHCSSPENGTVYWQMNYRSDFSWFLRVID